MDSEYYVRMAGQAETDLDEIAEYISAELGAPVAAHNFLLAFRKTKEGLSTLPQGRPFVRGERLAEAGYRWIGIKNYIAFFAIDETAHIVNVERVLCGKRGWAHLL